MGQALKKYTLNEIKELKNGVLLPEYICWWLLRCGMVGMIIYNLSRQREPMVIFLMCLNLFLTFIIPLVRFVFFKKILLGRLPCRIQSFIDVFVFAGSFLGHGLDYNGTVADYDKFMHLISGGLAVFIGWLILESVKGGKELSPALKIVGAGGFSCVVIIVWELFEFFADFFIDGSANQNWMYEPDEQFFFYKIFGYGAAKSEQYAVLDTDLDIFMAALGCAFCTLILYIFLKKRQMRNYERQSATSFCTRSSFTPPE